MNKLGNFLLNQSRNVLLHCFTWLFYVKQAHSRVFHEFWCTFLILCFRYLLVLMKSYIFGCFKILRHNCKILKSNMNVLKSTISLLPDKTWLVTTHESAYIFYYYTVYIIWWICKEALHLQVLKFVSFLRTPYKRWKGLTNRMKI